MKFAVIVPDGLGDWPFKDLGYKTPLDVARIPCLHELAKTSILGLLHTTPKGMYPGSDVCNLSLMGYDPKVCYTGRAPFEAANLGLMIGPGEMAFRCNLVTVDGNRLTDYSAGHVSTEEARTLIEAVQKHLGSTLFSFHAGKMYRHIMLCKRADAFAVETDQPHDFQGGVYEKHWPKGKGADQLIDLTKKSRQILDDHPVNQERAKAGKAKANMIWLWGGGLTPQIEKFESRFGVSGGVISAVDLMNGLGKYLGWEIISVPGATGYFDTDYRAKGEYAIRALDRMDLVFVHVEATDEAGHSGNAREKVKAIEQIDQHIVAPLLRRLRQEDKWRLFVAPDHYTPLDKKTHVADPVPFIFTGHDVHYASGLPYTEAAAAASGIRIENGHELMMDLIRGWSHK